MSSSLWPNRFCSACASSDWRDSSVSRRSTKDLAESDRQGQSLQPSWLEMRMKKTPLSYVITWSSDSAISVRFARLKRNVFLHYVHTLICSFSWKRSD